MKKTQGTSLAQYAIIIALIALALIPIFIIFGGMIHNHFSFFNNCLEEGEITNNQTTTTTDPKNINKPNDIKEPEKTCSGDSCSINFGNFILTGIPSNYHGFIETHGTSGGTDKLLSMLEQIADQLEEDGDIEGAKEYRELANLGHFLASIEERLENAAKACEGETNSFECFNDNLSRKVKKNLNTPENIKHLIPEFSANNLQFGSYDQVLTIDYAVNQFHNNTTDFNNDKEMLLSYAIADKFQSIINNEKYSDSMKSVTVELMNNISDLSRDIGQIAHLSGKATFDGTTHGVLSTYDMITGERLEMKSYDIENINDALDSHVSIITNIDSALICAAGSNADTGRECHK